MARESSEASFDVARSIRENAKVELEGMTSYSGRRSTAERDERGEELSRSEKNEVDLQPSVTDRSARTPPLTTHPIPTVSASPRRRSPRRSASPPGQPPRQQDVTRQTSYNDSVRSAESFFGVTLDRTDDGDRSRMSFAGRSDPPRDDIKRGDPPYSIDAAEAPQARHTPPRDAPSNSAHAPPTNVPLESAVGRHVLAWFETHELLEHDRTIAERASAAAENELRTTLRDAAVRRKERGREDANWIRWAVAGVVAIM